MAARSSSGERLRCVARVTVADSGHLVTRYLAGFPERPHDPGSYLWGDPDHALVMEASAASVLVDAMRSRVDATDVWFVVVSHQVTTTSTVCDSDVMRRTANRLAGNKEDEAKDRWRF